MLMPELGVRTGEHGVPLGHRLRGPVPVLHEHLRHALDPRPGARHRHRAGHHPSRPRRLGDHRATATPCPSAATTSSTPCAATCNITILLFNNQIYGLTKGQYSPTSEVAKVTKSTPFGSLDTPFNPCRLALGAEATFVARTHDMDRRHMMETFRRAHQHNGAAFVEVYQNCNVFNDGAFEKITGQGRPGRHAHPARSTASRSGSAPRASSAAWSSGPTAASRSSSVADVGADALLVHDEQRDDPGLAFALSRLAHGPYEPTPIGVFRAVERPEYGTQMSEQITDAQAKRGPRRRGGAAALGVELDGRLGTRPAGRAQAWDEGALRSSVGERPPRRAQPEVAVEPDSTSALMRSRVVCMPLRFTLPRDHPQEAQ